MAPPDEPAPGVAQVAPVAPPPAEAVGAPGQQLAAPGQPVRSLAAVALHAEDVPAPQAAHGPAGRAPAAEPRTGQAARAVLAGREP
jgi:hypothetical protein